MRKFKITSNYGTKRVKDIFFFVCKRNLKDMYVRERDRQTDEQTEGQTDGQTDRRERERILV